MTKQVGIIGWRGMVGSVLLDRMREEKDFEHITPTFFSTSQVGAAAPHVGAATVAQDAKSQHAKVHDANDIEALARLPMLISAQGGDYTEVVHPRLRAAGWRGYWIDAASTLRMRGDVVGVLNLGGGRRAPGRAMNGAADVRRRPAGLRSAEKRRRDELEVPLGAHSVEQHRSHHAAPADDADLFHRSITNSAAGGRRL